MSSWFVSSQPHIAPTAVNTCGGLTADVIVITSVSCVGYYARIKGTMTLCHETNDTEITQAAIPQTHVSFLMIMSPPLIYTFISDSLIISQIWLVWNYRTERCAAHSFPVFMILNIILSSSWSDVGHSLYDSFLFLFAFIPSMGQLRSKRRVFVSFDVISPTRPVWIPTGLH